MGIAAEREIADATRPIPSGFDMCEPPWRGPACGSAIPGRLRSHDLRHTYASHAVMSGENLLLISKLLGHRRHGATAGYATSLTDIPSKRQRKSVTLSQHP